MATATNGVAQARMPAARQTALHVQAAMNREAAARPSVVRPVQPSGAAPPSLFLQARRATTGQPPSPLRGILQCLYEKEREALDRDALFSSLPDQSTQQRIDQLIASGTTEGRRAAIELTRRAYGIGFQDDTMVYAADLDEDDEAETTPGKAPRIGPSAFVNGDNSISHLRLALTLAHENLHRQQFRRLGDFDIRTALDVMERETAQELGAKEHDFQEVQAYQSEIENLKAYRLVMFPDGEIPEDVEAVLDEYERDAAEKRDAFINKAIFSMEEKSALRRGDFREAIELIRKGAPSTVFLSYEKELKGQSYFHSAPVEARARAGKMNLRIERLRQRGRTKTAEYTSLVSRLDKLTDRYGLEVLS